jgi:hypothetical protein
MTEQATQDETVTVQIGFENALNVASPAWRETWSQVAIDNARFFYNQGVRDTAPFASSAIQNMQNAIQGLQGGYQAIEALATRPQQGGIIPDEIVAAAAQDTASSDTTDTAADGNADVQQVADSAVTNDGTAADVQQTVVDPTAPVADASPAVDAQPAGEAVQDALAMQSAPTEAPAEAPVVDDPTALAVDPTAPVVDLPAAQ